MRLEAVHGAGEWPQVWVPTADRVAVHEAVSSEWDAWKCAQVWLTLSNLVLSPAFCDRHVWTGFKKDLLGRVRGHMNELLYDQLPVLQPLQQFADQVVLTGGSTAAPPGLLVLEQVRGHVDLLMYRPLGCADVRSLGS